MSKQYLLMVEEDMMQVLLNNIKGIQFIEIQGLRVNSENGFNFLVTPVVPTISQVDRPPSQDMLKQEV